VVVPCSHELSADKTSTDGQMGITLFPYHIGLYMACPRELSSYDGARISPTEYTSPLMWVCASSLPFPPGLHPI
jgi:hypothetical protein